jgi:diguanylate cyclase (GGDEF)-like protein
LNRKNVVSLLENFWNQDFRELVPGVKKEIFVFFKELFIQLFARSVDIYDIYRLIIFLFNKRLEWENNTKIINDIMLLYKEILILAGLVYQNYYSEQKARLKDEEEVVFRINEEFINTFNLVQLKKAILSQLPKLEFKSFYLCLYNDRRREQARILLQYNASKNKTVLKRESFPAKELIPGGFSEDMPCEYLLMALYFKKEHLGYVLFEINTLNGSIYETLATQISSAIKGAMLTTELNEYTYTLKGKVKERTKELEAANKKLKELDSLKNDFIANITHDFRSPLTAILNVADLALRHNEQVIERDQSDFKIIYEASLKLKKTIDRLLDLAKMDAQGITLKITKVNIIALLNSIVDFYSSSVIGSGIKIIRKLPENEIENFYTDSEKFEEVINNLMSNAVKFVDPENGLIIVELEDKKDKIRISISDNGIGVAPGKLPLIFNRFMQVFKEKNSFYRGTGIGLSFSKQLVNYMKGSIRAESEGEGKGSRFIVEFKKGKDIFSSSDFFAGQILVRKFAEEKAIIQAELKAKLEKQEIFAHLPDINKEDEFEYKKGKILVIEDDKNIRKVIIQYLLHNYYKNFIQAADGKQGLEALYEYSPDLVICDYNMPKMKGDVFHDKMLTNPNFKHVPCLFLSAIADDRIIIERRQKGAAAYLKKPIDENDLLLTVEQQLKKYFEYLKTVRLATIDELTGLFNKRAIYRSLTHELFLRRYRDLVAIFLDIDHLKKINNTYGHLAGDKILCSIGELLKLSLRNYDIIGRYEGEEFVVILPETNLENTIDVAEGLRQRINGNLFRYEGKEFKVTASLGIASLRDNADYIGKTIGVGDLKNIFEIKDPKVADWKKIEDYKLKIANLLIKMANASMQKAKETVCKTCGFCLKKEEAVTVSKCPQCDSGDLVIGGNRVETFK